MANYDAKQEKALNEIADTLVKLDDTLGKLENTDGKVKQYFEQEHAIHEIKKIIRKSNRVEKLEEDKIDDAVFTAEDVMKTADENLKSIGNTFVKLDDTLGKLNEDQDSKVKSYLLQKKALHETKKIMHKLGFDVKFDENEDLTA